MVKIKKNLILILALIGILVFVSLNKNVNYTNTISRELVEIRNIEGNINSSVKIIEYSDFECPYCGKYYANTYSRIKEEYIDTGLISYEFRHFPLSFHKNAIPASNAAECAGEQNHFFDMHDILFQNQANLKKNDLLSYAKLLNLDWSEFMYCFDNFEYQNKIDNDFDIGKKMSVSGTPAFFINDVKIVGAQPFEVFKQAIDAELNKTKKN